MKALARILALSLAFAACAAPYHPVTPADVRVAATRFPGATRESLEEGRKLTLSHCTRCHRAFEPSEFRPEAWPLLVQEMKGPAGLDPHEEELVVRYLVTASETDKTAL